MTTIQVHLIMLGLGLLAYLFLAGGSTNRKSHSQGHRGKWWLGTLAAIAVALSPMSRFWRQPADGIELLTQSLLIAAICLLALLIYAVLRKTTNALRRRSNGINEESPELLPASSAQSNIAAPDSSMPIMINADDTAETTQAVSSNHQSTNTTDEAIERSLRNPATSVRSSINAPEEKIVAPGSSQHNDTVQAFASADQQHADESTIDDIDDLHTSALIDSTVSKTSEDQTVTKDKTFSMTNSIVDEPHGYNINNDQANNEKLSANDIEAAVQLQAKNTNTHKLDDEISQTIAANDNKSSIGQLNPTDATDQDSIKPTAGDQNRLDLSETEQLFAELRQPQTEVELPNEDELRRAKKDSEMKALDLDTDLIQDTETAQSATKKLAISEDTIEEAVVVDLDDTSLDFGNDLTGAYAHPTSDATEATTATQDKSHASEKKSLVPGTLDAAIVAAKVSALSLQKQVSNLENSITELDGLRDSTIDATVEAAALRAEHSDALLKQKDELLRSEFEARTAAESVIEAQSELIERAKREQVAINTVLNEERQRLTALQEEVDRSRKMARSAANLARRAAVAQQESKDIAIREQTARLKSQESTRKAVTIARNAISALAAEERKRNSTRQ